NILCQINRDSANFHIGRSCVTEWYQHQFGALTPYRERPSHQPPFKKWLASVGKKKQQCCSAM
ncbi:MAG: hypothetical protein J0M22_12480, partial [Gammaproteobacteria bacterium]|nr:hypothetical protein [Gammaproteobacteria bacterium]